MSIIYKVFEFKFDSEGFANALKNISEADRSDFAEVIGIDASTLDNWRNNRWYRGFNYPMMTNFLKACNALDLDPRNYFILVEREN